jgi:hypothetical protein
MYDNPFEWSWREVLMVIARCEDIHFSTRKASSLDLVQETEDHLNRQKVFG